MYIFDGDTLEPRFFKVLGIDAGGDKKREQARVDTMVAALNGKSHSISLHVRGLTEKFVDTSD